VAEEEAISDPASTEVAPDIAKAPGYLRPQYAKHWSYVRSVQWWKQHWKKTALVDVQCGELLAESDEVPRAKLMSASKRTAPQRPDIGREKAFLSNIRSAAGDGCDGRAGCHTRRALSSPCSTRSRPVVRWFSFSMLNSTIAKLGHCREAGSIAWTS
jgi:hypothetical protein